MDSGQTELDSRRSAQDEMLVAALAAGSSYSEAGDAAGVSARTVARRMADLSFARLVAERRREQVVAVSGRVSSLTDRAVTAVEDCLSDESARIRLTAAKLLLDWAFRLRRDEDLELRVAEIRQHLGLD